MKQSAIVKNGSFEELVHKLSRRADVNKKSDVSSIFDPKLSMRAYVNMQSDNSLRFDPKLSMRTYVNVMRSDINSSNNTSVRQSMKPTKHMNIISNRVCETATSRTKQGTITFEPSQMDLRKRKTMNYIEESKDLSPTILEDESHFTNKHLKLIKVPIYKQHIKESIVKTDKDVYKFECDLREGIVKKRRRDSDVTFNKVFEDALRAKKAKPQKKQKVRGKRVKLTTGINKTKLQRQKEPINNYTIKIEKICDKITNKIHANLIKPAEERSMKQLSDASEISKSIQPARIPTGCNGIAEGTLSSDTHPAQNETNFELPVDNTSEDLIILPNYGNDDNCNIDYDYNQDDANEDIDSFGFGREEVKPPEKRPILTILSNIQISPPKSFRRREPNANSTFVKSPWRFSSQFITRNPHYIGLKSSGLPAINQDAVLDHTFDDNIRSISNTMNESLNVQKPNSPKQTSLMDYISCSSAYTANLKLQIEPKRSLYDIEEFSPIKKNSRPDHDKENINQTASNNRNRKCVTPIRKNILNVIDQNVQPSFTSTPVLNAIVNTEESLVKNRSRGSLFGFNLTDDNSHNPEKCTNQGNLPYRLDVNIIKQILKPTVVEHEEISTNKDEHVTVEKHDDCFEASEEQIAVGLFEEDVAKVMPSKYYKAKRRPKWIVEAEQDQENDEDRPKKKRKNQKTAAEEEAARKWVKQFNAICEDIDKEVLEII